MYVEALESLLHDVPPNILKYVLVQFSKVRFYNPIERANKKTGSLRDRNDVARRTASGEFIKHNMNTLLSVSHTF